MHMVRADLYFINGNVVLLSYLCEQFFQPLLHITVQNRLAVFGCQYQMLLGSVDSVRRSSENHATILSTPSRLGSGPQAHCLDRSFLPAASSGASRTFFVNNRGRILLHHFVASIVAPCAPE